MASERRFAQLEESSQMPPSDLAGRDEEVIAVEGDAAVEADSEEDLDEDGP